MTGWKRIVRDAIVVAAASAAVGILFNLAREEGIPLVAESPYEIFVPCPEPLGEVDAVLPTSGLLDQVEIRAGRTLVIDAGSSSDFSSWHLRGAINIPFDYIEPVADQVIRRVASSRARHVVVYGDGADPDSGRELARELAGRGISNIAFVEGGVQALKSARGAE
ncbi:MAG TPA: rhodanese-like domain-containing protein [Myxococcota bacterium]|nr:rhodanese-like domain-containing protein [Myxococcota bacterium]HOA14126.1 rhodanese-like domain-containing protein [Myxococcota bacterium]HOC99003.1 rhodanese-like domain-containing protein [Myxococcota bacterium]HOH77297.1 rhodanese-like domain-containing protein [Myxococcota bacterium]HPV04864.1 rhodanese-like domain-containing protein [Myxococcota bacterium]